MVIARPHLATRASTRRQHETETNVVGIAEWRNHCHGPLLCGKCPSDIGQRVRGENAGPGPIQRHGCLQLTRRSAERPNARKQRQCLAFVAEDEGLVGCLLAKQHLCSWREHGLNWKDDRSSTRSGSALLSGAMGTRSLRKILPLSEGIHRSFRRPPLTIRPPAQYRAQGEL